jgi:hypothetical protein
LKKSGKTAFQNGIDGIWGDAAVGLVGLLLNGDGGEARVDIGCRLFCDCQGFVVLSAFPGGSHTADHHFERGDTAFEHVESILADSGCDRRAMRHRRRYNRSMDTFLSPGPRPTSAVWHVEFLKNLISLHARLYSFY